MLMYEAMLIINDEVKLLGYMVSFERNAGRQRRVRALRRGGNHKWN